MSNDMFYKKYINIFENSGIPIYTVSRDGYFVDVNNALCILMEGSKDEILKKHVSDFYKNPKDRDIFLKNLTSKRVLVNYPIKMKTLKNKPLDLIVNTCLWEENDENIMHHGVFIDVTEILSIRNKLINLEKFSYITEATKKISGDLGELLNKIARIVDEMILNLDKSDKNYDKMLEIENLTEKALGVVSGYSGSLASVYKPEEIEICSFLKNNIESLKDFLPENISIETEIKIKEMIILADFTQMLQVINGVIMNAVESNDGNAVHITVTVDTTFYPTNSSKKYVRVSVNDNGKGMNEETLSRIFEPFFTTKEGSKGMGMSNILSIIRNMGGEIFIESSPGKGTKVQILFPLPENKIEHVEDIEPHLNKKILFADDDDFLRGAVAEKLRKLNFEVSEAKDGNEALEKFKSTPFDLLILDMMMPDMTGWEVYKQILEISGHCPVIFISGYSDFGNLEYLKNIYTFITKPFKISDLIKAINE